MSKKDWVLSDKQLRRIGYLLSERILSQHGFNIDDREICNMLFELVKDNGRPKAPPGYIPSNKFAPINHSKKSKPKKATNYNNSKW